MPTILWVLLAACGATDRDRVSAAETCGDCRIVISKVATIGGSSHRETLVSRTRVVRDGHGRFFAAPTAVPGRVEVYDRTGRFSGTVGRGGPGPGELEEIRTIELGAGDSLFVIGRGGRVSVFGPDLAFARDFSLPGALADAVVTPAGAILAQLRLPADSRAERLYLLRASDGAVVRGIGGHRGGGEPLTRRLASDARSLWAVPADRLIVERYDSDGDPVGRFSYPDHGMYANGRRGLPGRWLAPPGQRRIQGIAADDRQLWLLLARERPGWRREQERRRREAAAQQPRAGEGRSAGLEARHAEDRFDRMVAAIDPDHGGVLKRVRMPDWSITGFMDAQHLIVYREEAAGAVLEVWRLRLEGR